MMDEQIQILLSDCAIDVSNVFWAMLRGLLGSFVASYSCMQDFGDWLFMSEETKYVK